MTDAIRWMNVAPTLLEFVSSMGLVGALTAVALVRSPPHAAFARAARTRLARTGVIAAVGQLIAYEWQGQFTSGSWWTFAALWGVAPPAGTVMAARETALRVFALTVAVLGFATAALCERDQQRIVRRFGWVLAYTGGLYGFGLTLAESTAKWRMLLHPLHLIAAGSWVGSLGAVLVAVLLPAMRDPTVTRRQYAVAVMDRFSPVAIMSAIVLLVTGVLSAAPHLTSWANVWHETYARVLALKLLGVGAVTACGAWNWRRLRPALRRDDSVVPRWILLLEVVAALEVVAMASVLVSIRRAA